MSRRLKIVLALLVAAAFGLYYWVRANPKEVHFTLQDGSTLTLLGTTYGTTHKLYTASPFQNLLARMAPESGSIGVGRWRWHPPAPAKYLTAVPAQVYWFSRSNPPGKSIANRATFTLASGTVVTSVVTSAITEPISLVASNRTTQLAVKATLNPVSSGANFNLFCLPLFQFPRTERSFRLSIYEPGRTPSLAMNQPQGALSGFPKANANLKHAADVTLPNPTRATRRVWKSQGIPCSENFGSVVPTLDRFRITEGAEASTPPQCSMTFEMRGDSRARSNWQLERVVVSDAEGNEFAPLVDRRPGGMLMYTQLPNLNAIGVVRDINANVATNGSFSVWIWDYPLDPRQIVRCVPTFSKRAGFSTNEIQVWKRIPNPLELGHQVELTATYGAATLELKLEPHFLHLRILRGPDQKRLGFIAFTGHSGASISPGAGGNFSQDFHLPIELPRDAKEFELQFSLTDALEPEFFVKPDLVPSTATRK